MYVKPCRERRTLYPNLGTLTCMREEGHPGNHFDKSERLYWMPGAPKLEEVELEGEK